MKPGLIIGGLLAAGLGYYYYEKNKKSIPTTVGAFSNSKGYTSMMKLPPEYYNTTSVEGLGTNPATYNPGTAAPWVLGSNGGDGMEVSAGWTSVPDLYSVTVSNNWLQSEAQGAHL